MTSADGLRILLFISIIVIVYVLAVRIVIRLLLHKLEVITLSRSSTQIWLHRTVLTLSLLGIACVAYGYFVEPYWLKVSRVKITTSKLPAGSQPLRIVHLSDLHSDPTPRLEGRLVQAIAAERPDLIVFTGDSINSPAGLPVFRECLTELARLAPTFAVKGNWDAWYWRHLNLFEGTGAYELDGSSSLINLKGQPVWIVGVAVENEKSMEQALASIPPGALKIFLYHYPDLIHEAAAQNVDLYCAGHTHGGQVALPLYGALITLSKYGKRYEAGLYREAGTWLYVNRGIGMEGGFAPRVRFWARPEVTVIELGPQS